MRRAAPAEANADVAALLADLDSALAVAVHGRQALTAERARAAMHSTLSRVAPALGRLGRARALGVAEPDLAGLLERVATGAELEGIRPHVIAWICDARAAVLDEVLTGSDDQG